MLFSTLDIVLPCFNPLPQWEQKVIAVGKEICKALPEVQIAFVIVNDGTHADLQNAIDTIKNAVPFLTYISLPENTGKGNALRTGIERSNAEVCIYTDIDFPYTTDSLLHVWNTLKTGEVDIVAGVKDKEYYTHVPAGRKFISRILQWNIKFFLGLQISDTQCGLKGFNNQGKRIFLQTTIHRYLFDLEFIFIASRSSDITLQSLPVQLRSDIQFRSMNWKILFTESVNFVKIFFRRIF
ncbi:MAG: glycosyltransferase family 2 protein [Chitinophagales bacterium]